MVAVAGWPQGTLAQKAKRPSIGFLGGGTALSQAQWTAAFIQRLHELSWIDGQTIDIEYRWLGGNFENSAAIVAEFVRMNVDVIVTHATPNVLAAKRTTSSIPIVFPSAGDPVGNGLVNSLARPGGNVTGLSVQSTDLASKLVVLLRDLLPSLRRLAILHHVGNAVALLQIRAVKAVADKYGLDVAIVDLLQAEDIKRAIEGLQGQADAVIVPSEPIFNTRRSEVISFAFNAHLPTIYFDRVYVELGGLLSYGPNWPSMWRRSADFVDRILRGAKPADIPVEQPTNFELVINRKTARALGLNLPRILIAQADDLID
jgi:putative ABC transport system substrate-binding protein